MNQLINITTHILNIETGIFYINDINKNHLVVTSKLIVVKNDSVTINLLKEIQNQKLHILTITKYPSKLIKTI